jgi:hypothetical protein
MHTPPRVGALPGSISVLVLCVALLACGGASKDGASGKEGEAKTPSPAKVDDAKLADAKAVDAKADAKGSADGAAAAEGGATPPPGADETGTSGPGPGTAASGPPPAATSGPADGGADETTGDTGGAVDPEALLKEIKSKKTKDARVTAAVTEAEAAGVDPAALAKALNARGDALYADPDRARPFFELANDKDPKDATAAFNLAKQAALVGDVDEAKKWLTVVHERKGKKLLKRIEFDPMWEIVKDDPDVRAMLK